MLFDDFRPVEAALDSEWRGRSCAVVGDLGWRRSLAGRLLETDDLDSVVHGFLIRRWEPRLCSFYDGADFSVPPVRGCIFLQIDWLHIPANPAVRTPHYQMGARNLAQSPGKNRATCIERSRCAPKKPVRVLSVTYLLCVGALGVVESATPACAK